MRHGLAFALLCLAACGAPSPADNLTEPNASEEPAPLNPNAPAEEKAALTPCGAVTADGYCGVAFGMAPAEAQKKFPVKLEVYSGGDPQQQNDPNRCYEMIASEPVQGISFLAEHNKIGRVDVISQGAKTADGFGVGTDAAALKAKFPAATEAPNKYEPEVIDLTVVQGATKFVFELQDGKVRAWRAGLAPTIDYVEHCG
ncbi:MAG TPA: hypothetical protein VG942_19500 [Hyphomonadaceae bacterium]|nr:hypothetical protein [Hyphomonadaceae bacterium]